TVSAIVIAFINIRGVRLASLVQTFVVSFLLIVSLLLLAGGFVGGDLDNAQPLFTGGASGFIGVMAVVPFLFVGFDVIPQSAEAVKIPPATSANSSSSLWSWRSSSPSSSSA